MELMNYWQEHFHDATDSSDVVDCSIAKSILSHPINRGWYEDEHGYISWIDENTEDVKNLLACQINFWGKNFVLFKGSRKEKLGSTQNIFDSDSTVASVFVYDEKKVCRVYRGLSMSSCFEEFGAIKDDTYTVTFGKQKGGNLKSNWIVNGGNPIDCLDGRNYAFIKGHKHTNPYSETQKNGIYIHSTNVNKNKGFAGTYKNEQGKLCGISTGCLLIAASWPQKGYIGWDEFNQQLHGVKSFLLKLVRT